MHIKSIQIEKDEPMVNRLSDYVQLVKFRLSALVVLSSLIAFLYAGPPFISWVKGVLLILGGFLVTGSANAINQLLEVSSDKRMIRTQNRPLPTGRMTSGEARLAAWGMGFFGLCFLYWINPLTALMGLASLSLYSFVYTPYKKKGPWAVFVGAIPGALSPVLGWVAATGSLSYPGWVFFIIQFAWQFPHFWAIAWVSDEDYRRAGFELLPSGGGRNKTSAQWIVVITLLLIPVSLLPYLLHMAGYFLLVITLGAGFFFLYQAVILYQRCTVKAALWLMFGSFLYLPVVQLALLIDKYMDHGFLAG